jgi:hypothetical protein
MGMIFRESGLQAITTIVRGILINVTPKLYHRPSSHQMSGFSLNDSCWVKLHRAMKTVASMAHRNPLKILL